MLKQSRSHKNLPAQWQGHTPDLDLFRYPHYTLDQQLIVSQEYTQTRNRKTILRLLSVFEHRQRFIQ